MKKILSGVCALASAPLLADTTESALETITGKVATELGNWNEAITGFFSTNFTTIATILGVALGITVLWVVFKLFSKGAKKVG